MLSRYVLLPRLAENFSAKKQAHEMRMLNEVGNDRTYSYHSVQVNLYDCMHEKDGSFARSTMGLIPDDVVYRELEQVKGPLGMLQDNPDEEYGVERHPHITLLYGLTDEADYFNVRRDFEDMAPLRFKVGPVASFRRDTTPYDVLLLSIEGDDVHKANKVLRRYDNKNKYPEYHPHMTLAYIKKGALKELDGKRLEITGMEFVADRAVWCHRDKYKLELPFKAI